jgi:hypothetical protein
VFAVGHLFHEYIQSQLEGYEKEVKVETDDILGFADLVSEDEVIDIKSQHSKAFWYMKKDSYDITKEKYTNILQVMTYCYLLGKPKGRLIFVSKDDLCTEEYGFHLDKWFGEVTTEIQTLREWWIGMEATSELPPAIPRAYGGKDCQYCMFLDRCKLEFVEFTEPIKEESDES